MKLNKLILSLLILLPVFFIYQTDSVKGATTFSDIDPSYRAYKQITYLAQGGIVSAEKDSSNQFYPNKHVTRAEVVTWIGKALNLDGKAASSKFKDVRSSHPSIGYIQSAVNAGIISGYTDGTFKPDQLVTRGEMALFISRAFDYGATNNSLDAMKAIMANGIAQGYTNGNFGAYDNIIRGDFAVFLARAIDYNQRIKSALPLTGEVKYVTSTELHVRTGPSTKYASITKLSKNTKVEMAYKVGPWTVVKSGDTVGFVSTSYLSDKLASTSTNPNTGDESNTVPPNTNTDSNADTNTGNDDTSSTAPPATNNPTTEKSLSGLKLVIDPGHGGADPGAVALGLKESDVVLDTSLHLKKLFESTPIQIIMIRETAEGFMKPAERAKYANSINANTFVSIHANAQVNSNKTANGTETWYYPGSTDGKKLASFIQDRLVDALDTRDRGLKTSNQLAVLNTTKMTSVLVELGFIDNPTDNAMLADPAYRQLAAKAIYNGILDYYKSDGYLVDSYYLH